MKYTIVNTDILHNGTHYKQGGVYDLDEKTAKALAKNLQKAAEEEPAADAPTATENSVNKRTGGKK